MWDEQEIKELKTQVQQIYDMVAFLYAHRINSIENNDTFLKLQRQEVTDDTP